MGLGYLSHWIISLAVDKKLRPLRLLVFQAVFYYTWKESNSRLHNNIHKPAHSLIKEIHLQIRARLLGLDRETLTKTASSHHLSFKHTPSKQAIDALTKTCFISVSIFKYGHSFKPCNQKLFTWKLIWNGIPFKKKFGHGLFILSSILGNCHKYYFHRINFMFKLIIFGLIFNEG